MLWPPTTKISSKWLLFWCCAPSSFWETYSVTPLVTHILLAGGRQDGQKSSQNFANTWKYRPKYRPTRTSIWYINTNTKKAASIKTVYNSIFFTLSSHCKHPTRFAIKGASQVAGECYTAVEVGQVSLSALALSTSVRSCTSLFCE